MIDDISRDFMDNREFRPLTIPNLQWDSKTLTESYGQLIAQPLEPGFGITLGNAIRRILLGGIEGSAVTSVIIKGVNNEFSPLPGVVEDTMQVVLNIKDIVVRNKTGKPGTMRVVAKGEKTVRVMDIEADEHLELINKEHIIAHVAPGGSLEIEFFVESGRGYQPAQWPEGKLLQPDDRMYLDAMFAPVRKVTFDVEKTRVGENIDYDKLILSIHTNASETPVEVVHYAVSVLRTQLQHFLKNTEIPFNEISKASEVEELEELPYHVPELTIKGIPVSILVKPIEELDLSVRAHNCLLNEGIKRVLDLVNLSEDQVIKMKNFGRKSLNEVKEALKVHGLTLGLDIPESELRQLIKSSQ